VQEKKDAGGQTTEYRIRPDSILGEFITVLPKDVVHYRLMGGRSPLEPLRRTLGIEDAATDWQLQALEHGPSLRGAFTTDKLLQDRTLPRLRAELEELYSSPSGKTLGIFDQGLAFHSLSQSAADVSLIETRKATREEAAATYGIPAPMVGILDHATYSNISELRRSFYVDTVSPYCTLIEETEEAQLITPVATWVREGVFTEFELGEILKPDPLAEAQSIMLLTSSGTNATNDNRKLKRMDPIGDPNDPANPYNRPRVPANLLDPEAPADPDASASLHDALVVEAMRGGNSTTKEEDDAPAVPEG
jgi:HK97 family phage portal protein